MRRLRREAAIEAAAARACELTDKHEEGFTDSLLIVEAAAISSSVWFRPSSANVKMRVWRGKKLSVSFISNIGIQCHIFLSVAALLRNSARPSKICCLEHEKNAVHKSPEPTSPPATRPMSTRAHGREEIGNRHQMASLSLWDGGDRKLN